jgi:hypothetical protein
MGPDCCDGSDELTLAPPCPNTCAELAAARRAAQEAEARSTQEGFAAKHKLVADAAAARRDWQQQADTLRQQVADADVLIGELDGPSPRTRAGTALFLSLYLSLSLSLSLAADRPSGPSRGSGAGGS